MSTLVTLVFNLVPAVSVWLFGWSAFALILLYWTENLVIGAINVLKIAFAGISQGKAGITLAAVLAPFFIFHYGLFLAIHAVIIWALFAGSLTDFGISSLPSEIWSTIRSDRFLFSNAILLAAYQVGDFLYWVAAGNWRNVDLWAQTFAPYGRIAVVHLTILVAAVPVSLFGEPLIAVVCLALLKTVLEIRAPRLAETVGFASPSR
jgi:hypothetical protein